MNDLFSNVIPKDVSLNVLVEIDYKSAALLGAAVLTAVVVGMLVHGWIQKQLL